MAIAGGIALAIYVAAGLFALYGGKGGVSSTELNSLSHAWLGASTVIAGILTILSYRYESNPVTGTFALIESRKLNRGKWILKGFALVPAAAAFAWAVGYGAFARVNVRLTGPTTRHEATIASAHRYDRFGAWCDEIDVRLQNGTRQSICTSWHLFVRNVPANVHCAKVGDRAVVAVTRTALGETLALLSIDTPDC